MRLEPSPAPSAPTMGAFFLASLRIGLMSFGGGITVLIHREFVAQRRWIGDEDFAAMLSVAQMMPGANVANLLIATGTRLFGWPGAPAAVVGLLSGPLLAVLGFLFAYDHLRDSAAIEMFTLGVVASAAGLLAVIALKTGRKSARRWQGAVVIGATVTAVGLLQLPLLPCLAVIVPISIALTWGRMRP